MLLSCLIPATGMGHIAEVAVDANIALDTGCLVLGGSLADYSRKRAAKRLPVPFGELLFETLWQHDFSADDK